jgi:hypothetical protein
MVTTQENSYSKRELTFIIGLAVLAMIVTTIAVVPALRNYTKEVFFTEDREILAKATGKISEVGPTITVLKIRSKNTLSLEIYSMENPEGMTLMAKIPLFETRDGYFSLKGNATNLALTDIDNDGMLEIVAPTFNEELVPRLNIYKYNPETKSFDRVNAPENH